VCFFYVSGAPDLFRNFLVKIFFFGKKKKKYNKKKKNRKKKRKKKNINSKLTPWETFFPTRIVYFFD